MSHFELYIECKPCRTGLHNHCSGKQVPDASIDQIQIKCICRHCKKEKSALDRIQAPVSDAEQNMLPSSLEKAKEDDK
jgi:hypothetical protein